MSIRRMMLFTLGGIFKSVIALFKTRVLSDSGNFEAETNLENQLNALGSTLFDSASLVITPNGVKTSKLYTIKPNDGTGDLTVSRNTTATRIDESGNIVDVSANVARIDYSNGSPAILVEPQRTNLLQRSEEFNNVYWNKSLGVISENSSISPNGTMTADLFTKTSGINTVSFVSIFNPYLTTGIHTLSIFVKPNVGNLVLLRLDVSTNTANAQFNFTTKTFQNTGANIISSSFKEFTNGWFRLTITGNVISTSWALDVCDLYSNPTNDSMYIWGAQLEVGSNATSYIPTTTTAVTRNADVISNTNASTLIGQTEGTIFIDYNKVLANDNPRNIISLNDGSTQNFIEIWDGVNSENYGKIIYQYFANSIVKISAIGQPTISPSGRYKICLTYIITPSLVNFKFFINGVKLDDRNLTYDAFSSPLSRINIGNRNGTFVGVGSHNLDFILKTRITDAQAIQLTTL